MLNLCNLVVTFMNIVFCISLLVVNTHKSIFDLANESFLRMEEKLIHLTYSTFLCHSTK